MSARVELTRPATQYCGIICIVVRRARRLNSAAPANVAVSFGDSRRRLHRTRDIESHEPSWQEVGYFPVLADLLHSDVMCARSVDAGADSAGFTSTFPGQSLVRRGIR